VYNVKGFHIILRKHWVPDINGTYHIEHRTKEIWITQGDIPWKDSEKAARIHYLHGLRPHSEPDDDTIKEAARTSGIEIIGKQYLHSMSHRHLARAFIVRVRCGNPELTQPPEKFQNMLRNFETCGLFAELTYDTTQSKPQFKIDISPEDHKKAPYGLHTDYLPKKMRSYNNNWIKLYTIAG
jgi:hypothetical protein